MLKSHKEVGMKAIIIFFLLFANISFARTAITPEEIINIVENTDFSYQFRGKLFGFYSLSSCVYRKDNILLVRNYCHDDKVFPAKSYYVISPELGMHYFYEEDLGSILQREITLNYFPAAIASQWDGEAKLSLDDLNQLLENLYYADTSACWVTNYSRYKQGPHSDCRKEDISKFPYWKSDSEDLVFDADRWENSLKILRKAAQR